VPDHRGRGPLAVLLALVAVLAVALSGCAGSSAAAGLTAVRLDRPYTVPDVTLTDTDGQPYTLQTDATTALTIVYFGYTRCDDICPATLGSLASAMTRLDPADRSRVQVVFVTSDPQHDTPAVMKAYLARFDSSFIGLTGTFDQINALARPLAVGLDKVAAGLHTTSTLAVTPNHQAIAYWDDGTSPAEFAGDIHTLLQES
jgi:protein SCO1/2